MADVSRHSVTGQEIHRGHRVRYPRHPARIVFVLGWNDFAPEFVEGKVWYCREYGEGFMVRQDDGMLFFCQESDEDLELVARDESPAT